MGNITRPPRPHSTVVDVCNYDKEETDSLFGSLPYELKLSIFSHLPVQTLGTVCSVSHEWRRLGEDEMLWKRLYQRDCLSWKVVTNAPTLLMDVSSAGDTENWFSWIESFFFDDEEVRERNTEDQPSCGVLKKMYHQSLFEDRFEVPRSTGKQKNFSAPSMASTKKENVRDIVMFGSEGEGLAKNMLYTLMHDERMRDTEFSMTTIYPGKEGTGSGVGFDVFGKQMSLIALHLAKYAQNKEGLLDQQTMPSAWKQVLNPPPPLTTLIIFLIN